MSFAVFTWGHCDLPHWPATCCFNFFVVLYLRDFVEFYCIKLTGIMLCFYICYYIILNLRRVNCYQSVPWHFQVVKRCSISANICLFKVNGKNTRKSCEIYSKLTILHQNDVNDVDMAPLSLILNIFYLYS